MTRKMNPNLQKYSIGVMLGSTKWNSEMVDIHSHIDRTLNYRENVRNIQNQYGIQTRHHGLEEYNQNTIERERARQRRNREKPYQSWRGIEMDMRLAAMRPGRRISRSHRRYYEYRNNRQDSGRGGGL